MQQIDENERVCNNRRSISSNIGIGFGLRCGHPKRQNEKGFANPIPGRRKTCEHFEFRVENKLK